MTLLLAGIAGVTLLLDAMTKAMASAWLPESGITVVHGLLELQLTYNTGMALGIMSGNPLASLLLPLAVMVAGWFLMRRYMPSPFIRVASGLVLGGFLGNFFERLLFGYVVDMIYFPFMPWFVCNLADIAICGGVGMLVISILFRPMDWRENNAKDDAHSPG